MWADFSVLTAGTETWDAVKHGSEWRGTSVLVLASASGLCVERPGSAVRKHLCPQASVQRLDAWGSEELRRAGSLRGTVSKPERGRRGCSTEAELGGGSAGPRGQDGGAQGVLVPVGGWLQGPACRQAHPQAVPAENPGARCLIALS